MRRGLFRSFCHRRPPLVALEHPDHRSTGIDPTPIVEFIRNHASVHQMALASGALCRTNRELMSHPTGREAGERVERAINGDIPFDDSTTALP